MAKFEDFYFNFGQRPPSCVKDCSGPYKLSYLVQALHLDEDTVYTSCFLMLILSVDVYLAEHGTKRVYDLNLADIALG